ncbi:MAG: hypothetical protein ABIH70_02750 [Chloroflexota bacterium]
MRRGCISLGEIKCDQCGRHIQAYERYLMIEEQDGVEADTGETKRYCTECAIKKSYAVYKEEKGEKTLTFFPNP